MTRLDMKALAQFGAAARVAELTSELAAIHRAFPALRRGRQQKVMAPANADADAASRRRRQRKPMSAAQKRIVGARMKKYWAAWRKQHGKA